MAQTSLQLRWELKEDVFKDRNGASHAVFTLTNRDTKALPAKGWKIYYGALHGVFPESVKGDVQIQDAGGDLLQIVPGPGFAGLAPGKTVHIEYLTSLLGNISQAPAGPYIVFDESPNKGIALTDFKALPFERPNQKGHAPRVVTPQDQFVRNEIVQDLPIEALPPIFPTPLSIQKQEGHLHLTKRPRIQADSTLRNESAFAASILQTCLKEGGSSELSTLRLEVAPIQGQSSPEAYELVIDPKDGIRIQGNSTAGVYYGLQSLRSLLTPGSDGVDLPAMRILDAPRFGYRGMHIDVARNFQPKTTILRVLDLMARTKLNTLHFHLTDDEGWRLEIPGLPELTTVGSRRGHPLDSRSNLPPAWGSGPDTDRPFGSGQYTKADYIEILRYAAARHIEVIPELEMPGHARAAIKAMEARYRSLLASGDATGAEAYLLSDLQDRSQYRSVQSYPDNVINPAIPSTYAFIQHVVDEIAAMHREAGVPIRNLHMGGDEVPAGVWEKSPKAQAFAKEHGFTTTDDYWFHFYGRVEQILKGHGLPLSGWEEIGLRKTTQDGHPKNIPNPLFAERGWRTYVWNNTLGGGAEDLPYRLANGGYKVVLCPVSNLYFDLAVNPNPEEPGLSWGGYVDVDKPFDFIPFDYYRNAKQDSRGNPVNPAIFVGKDHLTGYGRQNILGLQGCLWSETLGGDGRLDYMLAPKLHALAERAWAPDPAWTTEPDAKKAEQLYREDFSRFVNILGKRELKQLDRDLPGFNYRIPTPGLKATSSGVLCNLLLPGFTLRYTTDGTEPTSASPEVKGTIRAKGTIQVAAFDTTGRKGHTAKIQAD